MDRRAFVRAAGGGASVALAGCVTRENGDEEPEGENGGTLRVATRSWMVRGEEPASEWVRAAFEERYPDAEIEWIVPEAGVELYVRQLRAGAEPDADLYLGLTVPDLVAVDAALGSGTRLFEPLDRERLARAGRVRDELAFDDPDDRALPFATDFVTLVYDEEVLEPPRSFADLLDPQYGGLLVPDARTSRTGLAFLLWTISELGETAAFEYWEDLAANGVTLVADWANAYHDRYAQGEGSAIVGYSTAGLLASENGWEPSRHRVTVLEEGSYRTLEGVGIVADSPRRELAYSFVDFLLAGDSQEAIAVRGARHPAVGERTIDLPRRFTERVRRPLESTSLAYDELSGRMDDWIDAWADAVGA